MTSIVTIRRRSPSAWPRAETHARRSQRLQNDELGQTAGRARRWLTGLDARERSAGMPRINTVSRLSCLIACWVAEVPLGADTRASATRAIATRLTGHFAAMPETAVAAELTRGDAALVLLSARLLELLELRLPALSRFLGMVAEAVDDDEDDERKASDTFHTRYLLAQMQLCVPPAVPEPDCSRWPANLLDVRRGTVLEMCRELAVTTAFGAKRLAGERVPELAAVLPIWTLYYLRRYDLAAGAELLRTMNYAGLRADRAFDEGVRFLWDQQLPAGSFGYSGPDVATDRPVGEPEWSLHLPLTLTSLWTIAEAANPGFSLYRPHNARRSAR